MPEQRTKSTESLPSEGAIPSTPSQGRLAPSSATIRGAKPGGSHLVSRYGLLFAWAVLIAIFAILAPDTFFTLASFKQLARSQAALAILALAVVPTLTVAEIDLSVAAVMALAATVYGQLNGVNHWEPLPSLLIALLASAATGLVSGLITVFLKVQGLIVTLGMGTLVLGITLRVSDSLTVGGISPILGQIVNSKLWGINLAFFYAVIIALLLWFLLRHTAPGRSMLFLGFNREVARLSGINGNLLRLVSFVLGALIAGVAGVVSIGIAGGADPTSFQPLLLPAFAATFLGTLVFTPGQVNPLGSVVSLYFLATGIYGIQLLGAGTWVSNAFYGGALVIIIALSGLANNYGHKFGKGPKK